MRMPMKTTTPLTMVGKEESTADPLACHFSVTNDKELMECMAYLPLEECYLNLPANSAVDNPLDMEMMNSRMLTMIYNIKQPNTLTNTYVKALVVQLTMFCAMLSQETLWQTGK